MILLAEATRSSIVARRGSILAGRRSLAEDVASADRAERAEVLMPPTVLGPRLRPSEAIRTEPGHISGTINPNHRNQADGSPTASSTAVSRLAPSRPDQRSAPSRVGVVLARDRRAADEHRRVDARPRGAPARPIGRRTRDRWR